jgi:hypothetical protein
MRYKLTNPSNWYIIVDGYRFTLIIRDFQLVRLTIAGDEQRVEYSGVISKY